MSASALAAVESRVTKLEDSLNNGLDEIKTLIRQEIQDLKSEQLNDIKGTIDRVERDLKAEHGRLAGDQQRLWDRVSNLERRDNERQGSKRTIGDISHFISAAIGALMTAAGTWLLTGKMH
jgi:chromosome segregation ATPase